MENQHTDTQHMQDKTKTNIKKNLMYNYTDYINK